MENRKVQAEVESAGETRRQKIIPCLGAPAPAPLDYPLNAPRPQKSINKNNSNINNPETKNISTSSFVSPKQSSLICDNSIDGKTETNAKDERDEAGENGEWPFPLMGLSLMPQPFYRASVEPLFRDGLIDAIEWSMDIGWGPRGIRKWVREVLDAYSDAGRLYGHGVMFSPLTARFRKRQAYWLHNLVKEGKTHRYRHLTEHFGFMVAGHAVDGCPLPVPFTETSLRTGIERLQVIKAALGGKIPVGLENLALAMGMRDVLDQPKFIAEMLEATDGVMLLDLHNIYCQIHNWNLDPEEALKRYPLHRVRTLHIAGGSWCLPESDEQRRPFRRDTHDGDVPEYVITVLLPLALDLCPNVEVVILERMGETILSLDQAEAFREEYKRIHAAVYEWKKKRANADSAQPCSTSSSKRTNCKLTLDLPSPLPDETKELWQLLKDKLLGDAELYRYQSALLVELNKRLPGGEILTNLKREAAFAPFREFVETFEPRCVEVSAILVKKWTHFDEATNENGDYED